jgi:acetyl esterase/lipase
MDLPGRNTEPVIMTAKNPVSTVCVALLSMFVAACSPLDAVNMVSPKSASTTRSSMSYGIDTRQELDIYMTDEVIEGSPVVVFFYGGSWTSGAKEKYRFVGEAISGRGYVTVIPDYRLYPQVKFPAFVEDGARVLAWASEHITQAENGVVVMGHSAGAHTAALLALDHRYVEQTGLPTSFIRGMVGLAGPYGFNPLQFKNTRPIFEGVEPLDRARPVTFGCSSRSPMLLFHGAGDTLVYPENSRELRQRVEACGGTVQYYELEKTGHFTIVLGLSDSFLRKQALFIPLDAFLEQLSQQ